MSIRTFYHSLEEGLDTRIVKKVPIFLVERSSVLRLRECSFLLQR